MNNEDKILSLLEKLTEDVSDLKAGQAKLEAGQAEINQRLDRIDEDFEELKEHAEITRAGTNKLLDWAERSERAINVPLERRA